MESTKMKVLFMITTRGDKEFWTRIGTGFVNRDGSVNIVMEAMPAQGQRMQLRDYTPRDAEHVEGEPAPSPSPRRNERRVEAHQ